MNRALTVILVTCACTAPQKAQKPKAPPEKTEQAPKVRAVAAIASIERPSGKPFRYYVADLQEVIQKIDEGKKIRAKLMKLYNEKQRELDAILQRKAPKAELEARLRKNQLLLDTREHQEVEKILEKLRTHIRGHAEVKADPSGFELLDGADVIETHGSCDITEWLIESYERSTGEISGPSCFALDVRMIAPKTKEKAQLLDAAKLISAKRNALFLMRNENTKGPSVCDATDWLRTYAIGEQPLSSWPPDC